MYQSIAHIKHANRAIGHHFFDPETLQFFGSIVHPVLFNGRWFVTSELDFYGEDRRYTIREANETGSINTIGEFREYASLHDVNAAIIALCDQKGNGYSLIDEKPYRV